MARVFQKNLAMNLLVDTVALAFFSADLPRKPHYLDCSFVTDVL